MNKDEFEAYLANELRSIRAVYSAFVADYGLEPTSSHEMMLGMCVSPYSDYINAFAFASEDAKSPFVNVWRFDNGETNTCS